MIELLNRMTGGIFGGKAVKDVSSLGYDAVDDAKHRKQASPNLRGEDVELQSAQRQQLLAMARDSMRNLSIARWAVGKHLDFVSRFTFSSQTKTRFDYDLQTLMEEYANDPNRCDIMGRHTMDRIVRMTEARAVLDGDRLLLKLNTEHVQQVESDRLRSIIGAGIDGSEVHGVKLNAQGRALAYKIWKRQPYGGYCDPVEVPAAGALFHGYFPAERSDQVRGIGLISAGLPDYVDAYEWQTLTKLTAKLRTAFGIIVTSSAVEGLGNHIVTEPGKEDEGNSQTEQGAPKYEVDLGKGPFKVEMERGDDMKFLFDQSPSANTFEFFKSTIGFALKALDIPLSFYDEALTNFFGQRAALILYLESCKTKRRNLVMNILRPWTQWLIVRWVAQGRLRLPPNADINGIKFAWHPAGVPYWNPSQEINADIQAIQAGLGNWEDIYLERTGRDWFADMLRLKEQQTFLKDNDIKLDPKVIQLIQIATDPSQQAGNPLASLPQGVLAA